jgi:tRNA-specific 2-thiouridylase
VVDAVAEHVGDRLEARLRRPLRGVSPGQTMVLYRPEAAGDEVIGSATII